MNTPEPRLATDKQVSYCKGLFCKVKMYYKTLSDEPSEDPALFGRSPLVHEVLARTGFDLDNLTHEQAQSIIGKLKKEVRKQRR